MQIKDIFRNEGYLLLDASDIKIDPFIETPDDNQESQYIEPLTHVYMHEYYKEMFLILDCIGYDFKDIDQTCKVWESKVMAFINFYRDSNINNDIMKHLKYNISLIILCHDQDETELTNEEDDDHFRNNMEKSLIICKKIFILCDKSGEIAKNNDIKIPFYFEPIKEIESNKTKEIEDKLNELLPDEEIVSHNEIKKLSNMKSLDKDEIDRISRWLDDIN